MDFLNERVMIKVLSLYVASIVTIYRFYERTTFLKFCNFKFWLRIKIIDSDLVLYTFMYKVLTFPYIFNIRAHK